MYANPDNLLPPWVTVILRANMQSQSWLMMATGQGYTGHYLHLFQDTNSISLNMRLFSAHYDLFSIICHMHESFSRLFFLLGDWKKDWIHTNLGWRFFLCLSSRDDLLLAHVKHFWMKNSRKCEKVTFRMLMLHGLNQRRHFNVEKIRIRTFIHKLDWQRECVTPHQSNSCFIAGLFESKCLFISAWQFMIDSWIVSLFWKLLMTCFMYCQRWNKFIL